MKFGVIGNGIVGSATAKIWQTVGEVRTWDVDAGKRSHSFAEVAACDYVFACVPTPGTPDGPLDVSIVMETATKLSVLPPTCAVIRSTVNVGTTRKFQEKSGWPTVFWPEFLSMRTAEADALNPICSLLGETCGLSDDFKHLYDFSNILAERFGAAECFRAAETVEAAKLFSNAYGAAHVSLMNELAEIAEHNGLKWESVYECLKATGRVNETYSQVPGPDGKRGFGGHCFPKDLAATAAMGYECMTPILSGALIRNAKRDRNRLTSTEIADGLIAKYASTEAPCLS